MFYDISFLGVWLFLALALGVVAGWATEAPGSQPPSFEGWPRRALYVFVVALALAWARAFPGSTGFWLESAVLHFLAFVAGGLLGGVLRRVYAPLPLAATAAAGASAAPATTPAARSASDGSASEAVASSGVAPAAAVATKPATAEPAGKAVAPSGAQPAPAAAAPASPAAAPSGDAAKATRGAPPSAATATSGGAPAATKPATPVPPPPPAPPEPAEIGPVEGEEKHEGQRPVGLVSARGGVHDDLKRIKGIGPRNEASLHALGIWHFAQIAAWTPENVKWVGSYLSFAGRIDREHWIDQAAALAEGRESEFGRRAETPQHGAGE